MACWGIDTKCLQESKNGRKQDDGYRYHRTVTHAHTMATCFKNSAKPNFFLHWMETKFGVKSDGGKTTCGVEGGREEASFKHTQKAMYPLPLFLISGGGFFLLPE